MPSENTDIAFIGYILSILRLPGGKLGLKTSLNCFHNRYLEKYEPVSAYQQQALHFCFVLEMMKLKSDKTERCVITTQCLVF